MAERRNPLGKPEEENAASSSTQSANGLGGGTPEGGPIRPHERGQHVRDAGEPAAAETDDEAAQPDDEAPVRSEV